MIRRNVFSLIALFFGTNALTEAQSVKMRLAEYRGQIDQVDKQIVDLLNQRARIVVKVGSVKAQAHLPVAAPAREQQVLDHIAQIGAAGPLPAVVLRRIYQTVIREMRNWEETLSTPKN